jgi:acyl-CoA dehydrogenase
MTSSVSDSDTPFPEFFNRFKQTLEHLFHDNPDIEADFNNRQFPPVVLKNILSQIPMSVAIPQEYGGRGVHVKEILAFLEAASYESLPLSLALGINYSLFLEPVAKYAHESVKAEIFNSFLRNGSLGGLMITEPDFGSDALNMQTHSIKIGNHYHVKGLKHWQGLTGMADYWLMTARNQNEKGIKGRDIDFFICDVRQPEQQIVVKEYYENIGLYPIPYGRNQINIQVQERFKLIPETNGLKLMMDLLHRSRLRFPGMALGFIRRNLDEAIRHTQTRHLGGKPLWNLDQVQWQISRIQNAYTVCSAMCARSAEMSSIHHSLSSVGIEANSVKAYVSDLMQESAQTLTQLLGANGYKAGSRGSRGIVDSRPFQIFEGSNEMLYTQISEMVFRDIARMPRMKLADFLKQYEPTRRAADRFESILQFEAEAGLPQRKMVDLGKIISRIVAAGMVENMGDLGYHSGLVRSSLETIFHEVNIMAGSFTSKVNVPTIGDYQLQSNWSEFC